MAKFWIVEDVYHFLCPGCGRGHAFNSKWQFDGDLDNPTISPSILVTGHHERFGGKDYRCHSFIIKGRIRFLKDCTHTLAGQTVPLPECNSEDEWLGDFKELK